MSIPRPTLCVLVSATFAVLLVVLGLLAGAWTRGFSFDESVYYKPAVEFFAQQLPTIPLILYPFPAPPLGLALQAVILKATASWTVLRILSSGYTLGLAFILFRRLGTSVHVALRILLMLCFPFLLWNSYTLKHHVLAVLTLVSGLVLWESGAGFRTPARRVGILLLFTTATLINQFCVPFVAAIASGYLVQGFRATGNVRQDASRGFILVATSLIPLTFLLLLWRGSYSPGFTDPLPRIEVARWKLSMGQLAICWISCGAWLLPFVDPRRVRPYMLAALATLSMTFVWLSGIYAKSADFWSSSQGPISRVLSLLPGSVLPAIAGGFLCALGIYIVFLAPLESRSALQLRIAAGLYCGLTAAAVPYLFESYYLLLIAPAMVWLFNEPVRNPVWNAATCSIGIVIGIGYAYLKLIEPATVAIS